MTEALACKTCTPCRGEYLHSRASKLSSFTHRPQTGNWRRKLTASSGASGFAISGSRLPLFRRLVNSRKLKAHHPNISFGWGNATVSLQTKKIKGLHENDFIMATKIDRIFARTATA
jgi:4a-hydroxytetrahydrobiopterin dehydratase